MASSLSNEHISTFFGHFRLDDEGVLCKIKMKIF